MLSHCVLRKRSWVLCGHLRFRDRMRVPALPRLGAGEGWRVLAALPGLQALLTPLSWKVTAVTPNTKLLFLPFPRAVGPETNLSTHLSPQKRFIFFPPRCGNLMMEQQQSFRNGITKYLGVMLCPSLANLKCFKEK